jgi:NTE family protein
MREIHTSDRRPADARTGLVLGAGGALAWVYHLGVIEGLRESGLVDPDRADRIVGTSAGAATAAALLAGTSTSDFLAALASTAPVGQLRALHTAWSAARDEPPSVVLPARANPRRTDLARLVRFATTGAFTTSGLAALPIGHAASWNERLWVPAVRVDDGETVVFGRDARAPSVGDGVEASSAVPLLFRPKVIDGRCYVDGAVASPTHAGILADDGHAVVVISCPMARAGQSWSRQRARRLLRSEVALLQRAGCHTHVFTPSTEVLQAAVGYPLRSRSRRTAIVDAARRQVSDALQSDSSRARA